MITMNRTICVYSSSSNELDPIYFETAAQLGASIAKHGDILLFGGGMRGLMGATARAVHEHHGKVIGVIPEALNIKGVAYENCDEFIVTKDLRTREAVMDERSDAFIALPGGYGTLEELLEIITLKQLGYHQKAIVILNINGYYDPLLRQFDEVIDQHFARPDSQQLYFVTDNIEACLDYIDHYRPEPLPEKWANG